MTPSCSLLPLLYTPLPILFSDMDQDSQLEELLIDFPEITDYRGNLTFAEYPGLLPFVPSRFFILYAVPNRDVRGEHAHKTLEQLLICIKGNCSVILDNGTEKSEILLDHPTHGLYIPPMVWATQYKFSADAALLVLASDVYKAEDYIRNYDDYLELLST
jgi:UDP-2-acetamido-3-amino-2,3-dideoxy-glucuronate N-acetyltransferase